MSGLRVLVVEDDAALAEAVCDSLGLAGIGARAVPDGTAALAELASERYGLVLSDVQMEPMDGETLLGEIRRRWPELPVVLMTAYGTIERAVAAMHRGARDYLVKPFDVAELVRLVRRVAPVEADPDEPVAEDPATRRLVALARRVAASDATVLLAGESGTGKEVFARLIHRASPRRAGPFVAVNCAAIPDNMLEALLFGHEKGAFTGAVQAQPGKFELAQSGTLLLDEISEMDVGLQAKLLRVLQEREVERLGARASIELDVRVLATTNRDLAAAVREGRFREDLYYRLNVFPLRLPPLRERPGDIGALARRLLARHADGPVPELSAAALRKLEAHPWPGNVRELQNVVQRALILASGGRIGADDLLLESLDSPVEPEEAPVLGNELKDQECRLILDALRAGGGSRQYAADRLGISPRTLRYKLARLREAGVEIPPAPGMAATARASA